MTAVAALLIISVVAIVIINIKKRSQKRLISAACKEIFEDIKLWNEQNGNKKKYANLNAFYMNWCRKESRRKPKSVSKVQSDQKDKTMSVRSEKGLTSNQINYMENIIARVEKLQNDPRYSYTNFDRLRKDIETAMRQGTLQQILDYYGMGN